MRRDPAKAIRISPTKREDLQSYGTAKHEEELLVAARSRGCCRLCRAALPKQVSASEFPDAADPGRRRGVSGSRTRTEERRGATESTPGADLR